MTILRPAGINCTKWEPTIPGAKACRYYIRPNEGCQAGMCELPDEVLCVEWVSRYGSDAQKRNLLTDRRLAPSSHAPTPPSPKDPEEPPPLVLRAQDPPPPRAPARVAVPGGELQMAVPRPYEPAKAIDPASLEALEAAGVEVELSAPHLAGSITLVTARTGRTDRNELTYRESATLRLIVDAFPGAHVVAYRSASGAGSESRGAEPLRESFDDCPLDPMAGSGSTGVAAMKLGRPSLLIEQSDCPMHNFTAVGAAVGSLSQPEEEVDPLS